MRIYIEKKKNWTWNIKYWNLVLELLTLSTKAWFSGGGPKRASTLSHPRKSIPLWTRQPNSFCSFTRLDRVDVRYLLMFCASRNRNSSIREKVTFVRERERMRTETWNMHVRVTNAWLESDRGTNRVEINHLEYLDIFETLNTHTYTTRALLCLLLLLINIMFLKIFQNK